MTGTFESDTTMALQQLFEDRQIADYDWVNQVDAETGAADVAAAEKIVTSCRNYIEKKND